MIFSCSSSPLAAVAALTLLSGCALSRGAPTMVANTPAPSVGVAEPVAGIEAPASESPPTAITASVEKAIAVTEAATPRESDAPRAEPLASVEPRTSSEPAMAPAAPSPTADETTREDELALVLPATAPTTVAEPNLPPSVSSLSPDAPPTSTPSHQLEDDRLEMCFELK